MGALQDVKDYLASIGVPAGRYSDAALNQAIATEAAAQSKKCRVPSVDLPSGLALWFRAEDLSGLADGDPVSSWTSAAGTSVATQGTGSAQPTKRTQDGRTLVRFDGTDWLSVGGDALQLTRNQIAVTILMRVKSSSATTTQRVIGFSNNGLFTRLYAGIRFSGAGGHWGLDLRRLDGDAPPAYVFTSGQDQALHNVALAVDHGHAVMTIHVDGVLKDTVATALGTGPISDTPSAGVGLGADEEGGSPFFGDVYEVLVWQRVLSDGERLLAEGYLAGGGGSPDLREALARRVVINFARRGITLGVVEQSSDGGSPSFVPRQDAEVKRLEAPYRKLVVG